MFIKFNVITLNKIQLWQPKYQQYFNSRIRQEKEIAMETNELDLIVDERCGKCLTERECEVLKRVIMGKSNTEIARELLISVHTAKAHVCSILRKLCVNDRVQAAVKAVKESLLDDL